MELYNLCFKVPPYDYYNDTGKYLLEQSFFEYALNIIQRLADNCTKTPNIEFNKIAHKMLGAIGAIIYTYYKKGTCFIDRAFYETKLLLDISSIYHVADFFDWKYNRDIDCYLIMLECDSADILQFPLWDSLTKKYIDTYMVTPICLFKRGEIIKVKRISDKEYKGFSYNPSQLISSLIFTVSNNSITAKVDNTKWSDSAWNL